MHNLISIHSQYSESTCLSPWVCRHALCEFGPYCNDSNDPFPLSWSRNSLLTPYPAAARLCCRQQPAPVMDTGAPDTHAAFARQYHGDAWHSEQAASLCPLFSPVNIWSGHPRDTFAKCNGTFYVNKQCKFTLCLCKICSSNDIDGLSKTIQDSSVYPILVKPWTVNKVTCGSLLTFLDAATPDVTVSFDACLVALILLNLFIFGPLLWADVGDKFSNIFFSFQDRIDRIENAMGLENHFDAYKNPTFLENIISTIHNNTYLGRYFTLLQF